MSYLQEQLLRLVGNGNVKFTQSLHPRVENILGLRVPDVRALARRIAADPDWTSRNDLGLCDAFALGVTVAEVARLRFAYQQLVGMRHGVSDFEVCGAQQGRGVALSRVLFPCCR